MVQEERSPALRRWAPVSGHVLGNRSLADIGAELEEFSWMRGAPQKGFARLISRISCRTSRGTLGLPGRGRDFQRQKVRNPARCHRTIVSGRTIVTASRTVGASRYSNTKIRRSNALRAGRLGVLRRSTFNWCRSAITSPSSELFDRKRSRRIHLGRLKSSSTRRSSPDSGAQTKRMEFAVATGTRWLIRVAQIARGHPMRSFIERWKMSQVACNVVCRYGCKNLRKVRR